MNTEKNCENASIIDNITEIKSNSTQKSLDTKVRKKKKTEKTSKLSKDQHYYQQNKKEIRKKARERYRLKMRDRKYRFEYLAKQRYYNKSRRKNKEKFSKYNLLYPYDPFKNDVPVYIIYDC